MLVSVAIAITVALLPLAVGALALAAFGGRRRGTPQRTGLVVHAIRKRSALDCSYVSPETISAALDAAMAAGIRFVTVGEIASVNGREPFAALTFDDGYEEVISGVLPILAARGIRATFFPIAGALGTAGDTSDVFGRHRHASTEMLRAAVSAGHEIGSHTLTHADLTLVNDKLLHDELAESKRRLEDAVGAAVRAVSFPYGNCSARVWRAARDEGYEYGVVYGGLALREPGLYAVDGVYAFDTVADFVAKLLPSGPCSNARARAAIMPHFARGTALWRFRPTYALPRA